MLGNLSGKFLRTLIYALLGNAAAAMLFLKLNFHPSGGAVAAYAWNGILAGSIAGAVALLKRLATWDPAKS